MLIIEEELIINIEFEITNGSGSILSCKLSFNILVDVIFENFSLSKTK